MLEPLNWPAIALGTIAGFALGMIWFSPRLFGGVWSRGSHNITPPATMPWAAMATTLAGTFLLALLIGLTAQSGALATALVGIAALAVLQMGMALFSQKTPGAALVDASYMVAMGALMILAQGLL